MALWKSLTATSHMTYPVSGCAWDSVAQRATYTFDQAAGAVGDIIDLGVLPGGHVITDLRLLNVTGGAVGVVAILSGSPGHTLNDDDVTARTLDTANPLVTVAAPGVATDYALLLAPVDNDRSIGIVLTNAIALDATKFITLQIGYAAI